MSKMRGLMVAVVLVGTVSVASAEDKKIDNPEYGYWAKYKPGTTSKLKMTNEFGGNKTATTIVTKLVEVKDDKLVVEMETETELMGKPFKAPPQKRDVPKVFEVKEGQPKPPMIGGKPEGTTEEGTETVKVGGTEVKTKWYKYKTRVEALGETNGQVWMSDEVPGSLVKMTTKSDKFSMTMELVEFTKK
jgi:hypothetical protein